MKKIIVFVIPLIVLILLGACLGGHIENDFYTQFLPNIAATIIGGIFLTAFFFYLKECIFPYPNISGVWEAKEVTGDTSHSLYKGMEVVYKIVLLQDGGKFFGSGERDRENSIKNSTMPYSGAGRIRITIEGVIDKKYFGATVVNLHWVEDGSRETSTVHRLSLSGSNENCNLFGSFYKTAANASGVVSWTRISN